jgi:hypothetical protein
MLKLFTHCYQEIQYAKDAIRGDYLSKGKVYRGNEKQCANKFNRCKFDFSRGFEGFGYVDYFHVYLLFYMGLVCGWGFGLD